MGTSCMHLHCQWQWHESSTVGTLSVIPNGAKIYSITTYTQEVIWLELLNRLVINPVSLIHSWGACQVVNNSLSPNNNGLVLTIRSVQTILLWGDSFEPVLFRRLVSAASAENACDGADSFPSRQLDLSNLLCTLTVVVARWK